MDPQPPPPGFMPPPPYEATAPMYGAPPPYNTQAQAGQNTVIIVNTPLVLGPEPQSLRCPFCLKSVVSRIEMAPFSRTHLTAVLMIILGLWICAPCVYCMDCCLAKKHYCPSCNNFLGTYKP